MGEPVDTYELTGTGPARSRLHAAAARGLSRFVGRDPEMEQLRRVLEQARQGHGQVAAIVGEPGVGKSRLVFEFTHSHRLEGWLILEAGSVSYGKATTYLPVIDLLKAYFKIHDRDTHRDIHEKATGKILTLDRALEPVLPALLALLDVPVDDPHWQAADPSTRRQRTLGGLKQLLLRESQAQPLLLVFEDLHWVDSETQALLDSLIESLPAARLLLLVNYRPEYHHAWSSKTYYTQLRLDTLPPESTGELLQALVGHDPSLEPLKALLPVRTGGNPLFIEESVRALVETGMLVGDRGAYRLARPLEAAQVPATVQAILAARIDRLPPEEKQLLQTAAVIGKDVPFALLQAVADEPEEALRSRLAHLQAAEFLYEQSLFPDLEHTFKHALTHEVAYESLLHERRRALHARIVEATERIYAGRLDEQVERLAQHAARGEAWEKAVAYARQAGARAGLRSAFPQAARSFEEALAALAHLPASRETLALSVDLTLDLRGALVPLGEVDRVLECARRASTLAESLGDEDRLARATDSMTNALWLVGDAEGAVLLGERVLTSAEARGDVSQQIQARLHLGPAYEAVGDYRRAIELLERNVEALGGDPTSRPPGSFVLPGVFSRAWLAGCLAQVGEFARAIQVAEEGARLLPVLENAYNRLAVCWGLGVSPIIRGDHESAIPALEQGLALARESGTAIWISPFGAFLGYAYARRGQLAKGLALLDATMTQAESVKVGRASWLSLLSEALLLAGRQEEALAAARCGLDGARERRERGYEAMNLQALAEVAAHADPPDVHEADRHYREALALATELGMRPRVARCHAGLATLSRRTGQRAEADEHFKTATTMYREMGMTYWLEQAETEMKEVGRNDPRRDSFPSDTGFIR